MAPPRCATLTVMRRPLQRALGQESLGLQVAGFAIFAPLASSKNKVRSMPTLEWDLFVKIALSDKFYVI